MLEDVLGKASWSAIEKALATNTPSRPFEDEA